MTAVVALGGGHGLAATLRALVLLDVGIETRLRPELVDPVRIRQEARVEDDISIDRDAVLEAE